MSNQIRFHDLLARVLSYPGEDYLDVVREFQPLARKQFPYQPGLLDGFVAYVEAARIDEIEEHFTRTFDLNPVCCMEIGWQLYGEDYNRGSLMVNLRQQIRSMGLTENVELPDHLSNVLPLLGRMDPQEASNLCASYLLPAVKKMQDGLKDKSNPYEEVLALVRNLFEASAVHAVITGSQSAPYTFNILKDQPQEEFFDD